MFAFFALTGAILLTACSDQTPPPGTDASPADTACAEGEIDDGGACVPEACGTGTWGDVVGAAFFVDAAAAEGGDGSQAAPLRAIQDGADAAGDAGGGVVAVAAGAYLENLSLGRSHDAVEISGRCAELVVLDGSGGGDDMATVHMSASNAEVVLRGLTITGGPRGGVVAQAGTMRVHDSGITGNVTAGVVVLGADTTVVLTGTIVSETRMSEDGDWGLGIHVQAGATLQAGACAVTGNHSVGVLANHEGTTVDLVDTNVSETRPTQESTMGIGVAVQDGAHLAGTRMDTIDNHGPGLYSVEEGSVLSCASCSVERNAYAGAVVIAGGELALADSIVTGNLPSGQEGGGLGIFAWKTDGAPPTLRLSATTIGPHAYAAVWLRNAGSYVLEDNDLSGGDGQDPQDWVHLHGDAVYVTGGVTAWDEDTQTGLLLAGNTLRDSAGAGLLLNGSAADIRDNTWTNNATDLVQQRCESTVALTEDEVAGVPTVELCPAENYAVTELDYALILAEAAIEYD
jgi:hypothetical protein